MSQIPKRHCWECRWRGLVCDFTRPGCKRCSAAAIPCPGYGEKEPQRLKWLTPGKAKAWTRKSSKEKTNSPPDTNRQSDSESPKELVVPTSSMKSNEDAIFQAIEYYNSAMYPLKVALNELGDNPTVLKIEPAHIKVGITKPDFVRLNMVCMAVMAVAGDTSSPASDLVMTPQLLAELDVISSRYGNLPHVFWPYPSPLFMEIAKINFLRARSPVFVSANSSSLTQEAWDVLSHIDNFQPEIWAEGRPSKEACVLLACLMQAAVAIYCIFSLQSALVFPQSDLLKVKRSKYRELLYDLLQKSLNFPAFGAHLIWPLLILGVDAVDSNAEICAFLMETLPRISYREGSHVPLLTKDILERFWASGKASWDACFDKPYLLPSQWSVSRQNLK